MSKRITVAMVSPSDTPRTDAVVVGWTYTSDRERALRQLAEQLERELEEAKLEARHQYHEGWDQGYSQGRDTVDS